MKKRRISYSVYFVMILAVLLTLLYESFQPKNIETVTIISGAGLEKGEEKAIKLIVQIIKPEKGDAGSSKSSCIVLSAEGDSVSEACEGIILKTGSALFWAHCSVIILNREFAESEDIVKHLDMFFRSSNFRNTTSLLISDEKPEDILNADTMFEMISAFGIQRMLDDQEYESNSIYMPLKEFIKNYYTIGSSAIVAGISTEDVNQYSGGANNGSESEETLKTVILSDCAVFKEGKFVSYLDPDEFDGFQWMTGNLLSKLIVLKDVELESEQNEKNTLGVSLFSSKESVEPIYEDGKYILKVKINTKAEIVSVNNELQISNISHYKLENRYDEFENLIKGNIEDTVRQAWQKMIEINCDFCEIEDAFYCKYGKKWKNAQTGKSDSDIISDIELEFDINVTIITGGLNKRYKLGL